jgi:hypothetical protein
LGQVWEIVDGISVDEKRDMNIIIVKYLEGGQQFIMMIVV